MSVGKRIGKVLLCMLPMIIAICVQLLVGFALNMVAGFVVGAKLGPAAANMDQEAILQEVVEFTSSHLGYAMLVIEIAYIIAFGLWFYYKCGKQKFTIEGAKRVLSPVNILLFVLLGEGMEVFLNIFLAILSDFFPAAFESYNQMMQNTGIGQTFLMSFVAAVFAPVAEEIIFRGVTFTMARKAMAGLEKNKAFWIANVIQALAFGIFHMNLIQGLYAFFLGLVFGYVTQRYRSIVPGILLHLIFNGTSAFLWEKIVSFFPDSDVVVILICVVGFVVGASAIYCMGPVFGKKEREM